MAFVVSFAGFRPPPRYDGVPWTSVRIDEAASAEGPWTAIDSDPITPAADPSNPDPISVTTDQATNPTGWFRLTFIDDMAFEGQSDPMLLSEWGDYYPSVADVGLWLRARTKDANGNEIGTFTPDTRPTRYDAERIIALAAGSMPFCVGSWLPPILYDKARVVVAIRAAMIIEQSYWPEQLNTDQSPYEFLRDRFVEEHKELCDWAANFRPDDLVPEDNSGMPSYYFGDGRATWLRGSYLSYDPDTESIYERPVAQWWST